MRRGAMMNQRAELKLLTWYSKPCNKLLFIKFLKLYRPAVKLDTYLQSLPRELRFIVRFHYCEIFAAVIIRFYYMATIVHAL